MSMLRILLVLGLLCSMTVARAATFSDVYIFGDSLSDTRVGVSNGPLWIETFAPLLGLSYNQSHNYAVAGSTTDRILDAERGGMFGVKVGNPDGAVRR